MKRFAPLITCCYLCSLFLPLTLRANVLPVSETTVTGAAADDYYKSSRAQLRVISNDKVGQTLIASEALSSTAALSGLVSGAAGIAGVAYYERTGKDPVYAVADAVASAADALFAPAYQAFKASFVSPESYPATASQYVGVEGSVGAKLGDIADYVKSAASDAFPYLKQLIADNTPNSVFPASSIVPGYSTARLPDGQTFQITGAPNKTSMNYYTSGFDSYMLSAGAVKIEGFDHTFFMSNKVWWLSNDFCQTYNGKTYYRGGSTCLNNIF